MFWNIHIYSKFNQYRTWNSHAVINHANTSNGIKIPTFFWKKMGDDIILFQCLFKISHLKKVVAIKKKKLFLSFTSCNCKVLFFHHQSFDWVYKSTSNYKHRGTVMFVTISKTVVLKIQISFWSLFHVIVPVGHSLNICDGYVRPHWAPFSNRLSLNDPLFIFHILLSPNDPHFQNDLSLNDAHFHQ